jgi:hypothetical protein
MNGSRGTCLKTTGQEVEEKFAAPADGVLTRPRQRRVLDTISNLEASSVTSVILMETLKAGKRLAQG